MTNSESPHDIVRRGLLKIDSTTVLAAVDTLNLKGGKVSAVVGVPLRTLQQRRDVTLFCATAPIAAVRALLELLAMTPLDQVIVELGDHADSPSYDQLNGAVDRLVANGSTPDEIVALLSFAVGEAFPAAPHCRRLLSEHEEFHLPELPEVAGSQTLLSIKEVDPDVKEQRRARRERDKKVRRTATSSPPSRPAKVKTRAHEASVAAPSQSSSVVGPGVELVTAIERRRVLLTPVELEGFSTEHPLAGVVILADVPFDSIDPVTPEQRAKERPALVVAGSSDTLLVRGIYSHHAPSRSLFSPWRRLDLDHVSYIDDERVAVSLANSSELVRLGRLTDHEWNAIN